MEIKIYCDASVKIENFNSAFNVKCSIVDYKKVNDTLDGNILITGEFIKDNLDEKYPFSEVVPFAIVFKNENFKIDSVVTKNFTFQEIVNQGIEANFDIVVKYQQTGPKNKEEIIEVPLEEEERIELPIKEEVIEIPIEIKADEKPVEVEIIIDEEDDEEDQEIILEDKEEKKKSKDDELTKDLINKKYDELLKEVLETRTDNFFETPIARNNIKILQDNTNRQNILTMFDNVKEEYRTVKVRFIEKESDLEKISKKEKVSIDKIYQDNKNNQFIEHRRIIIK